MGRSSTPIMRSAPGLVLLSPATEKEWRVFSSRHISSVSLLVKPPSPSVCHSQTRPSFRCAWLSTWYCCRDALIACDSLAFKYPIDTCPEYQS